MEKGEISIQVVLAEINTPIDEGQPRIFSIGFIRKTPGPKQGTFKLVDQVMKRGKDDRKQSKGKQGAASTRQKEKRLLLLYDVNQDSPFFVPLETIIYYNGYRVRH